ncbi:MAG: FAD-binding protein [Lachnospiraceae bacterium]|nr:FAD-binding protein [Lachnospiraceae bacterium]
MNHIFVISDDRQLFPELCAGARTLSENVTAVAFGDETSASELLTSGPSRILCCPVDQNVPEDYASCIAAEVKKTDGALLMVANTIRGRCLAGKLGVCLDTAVLSTVNEIAKEDGRIVLGRVVYGGTAQRKESFLLPYGVITVNGGVFEAAGTFEQAAEVRLIEGTPDAGLTCVSRNEKKEGGTNLVAAKRIIDVGRGLAKEEDLEICRKLASVLDADVGCSRPVAENNKWLPKANYMGITGVQVKPDLIITVGVSGQVQHIGGINKSKVIVAINKDKAAPIFKNCDFGLVGDLYKIVPALTEKLS